ncbi:hypothetical protein [Shewanella psychropiezotolerans]|uniref:hypothetical protein n=1 Tax=Shewanella psychropiezotolerans TaxID=2593655 RepID=UPI00163DA7B4|nr:hypothetical protein [Shewanella psychropiezotolerans]
MFSSAGGRCHITAPKDRFASLDLLNIHDLLNEKSGDSRNDLHYQSELDIPTYTRQKQLN